MELLWFGDLGRRNSFSRITESVIPHLDIDITLLAPRRDQIDPKVLSSLGSRVKIHHVGEPVGGYTFSHFQDELGHSVSHPHHRYICFQMICLLQHMSPHAILLLVCGVEDANFMVKLLRDGIPNKIFVWTPLDYFPKSLGNLVDIDLLLTMTPNMKEYLDSIPHPQLGVVGHGVSSEFRVIPRKHAIDYLNQNKFWTGSNLEEDDIIILQANNMVQRKNHDLTLQSYSLFKRDWKGEGRLRLWLHTNLASGSFWDLLSKFKVGDIIYSHNNQTDYDMNMIYNVCQIGIQTSSGEAWSLTNCEHARVGGIQVVPHFLACQHHFEGRSGHFLIPVSLDEDSKGNILAKMKIEDIVFTLRESLILCRERGVRKIDPYFKEMTWKKVGLDLSNALCLDLSNALSLGFTIEGNNSNGNSNSHEKISTSKLFQHTLDKP